jgi:hypothetical protein
MIGALVVTPFAFASAGVVLGDVGPIEALRRSVALFRARPRISIVVTLFTLLTSAIQTFAIGAGADAAVRVGELMHLNLEQGGIALVITAVIVLAFIVAFGSLTFTIAAIVAAPQVAGFLGLTYYSGGLDKARSPDGIRPRRFRWVSLPMVVAMVGLLVLAGLGLPSVSGFQPRPASALLSLLRSAATEHDTVVFASGVTTTIEDATHDVIGSQRDSIDIVGAGYAFLTDVPSWLLADLFDCSATNVVCEDPRSGDAFAYGAYLFHQQMAAPPDVVDSTEGGEWGPLLDVFGYAQAPLDGIDPRGGASHAILIVRDVGVTSLHLYVSNGRSFDDVHTFARSTWIGNDLLTIVPLDPELDIEPIRWEPYAAIYVPLGSSGHDGLRASLTAPLHAVDGISSDISFTEPFGP